jgi:hypothetical protein
VVPARIHIAQDVSAVSRQHFSSITTFDIPSWSMVLGLIYLWSQDRSHSPYNRCQTPIIAANIFLAYLVAHILNKLGVEENISRKAWIFLLFNPFLLLTSSAWGQFDTIVALLSLLSLLLISEGKLTGPAILLALAVSLKPTALPLALVVFVYLAGKPLLHTLHYFALFSSSMLLFCAVPFVLFGWDPSPILRGWNFHFTQGGGLSYMTFLEYTTWSYQLSGRWWFLGWVWVPAVGLAAFALKPGMKGLKGLLRSSLALILVFYLFRAWLSETNINLILPLVLILTSINGLYRLLAVVWSA